MQTPFKVTPLTLTTYSKTGITTSLMGAYHSTRYYPDREQRLRPSDVFAFALSNTPRLYYVHQEYFPKRYTQTLQNGTVNEYACISMVASSGLGFPGDLIGTADTLTQLRLKIKDQKASLGMALAQYRKSAKLFYGICNFMSIAFKARQKYVTQLVRYTKRMARWRRNPRGPKPQKPRPPRGASVSDAYLAYLFGVKPMYQDLLGSIEVLADRLDRPVWLYTQVSRVDHHDRVTKAGNHLGKKTTQRVFQRKITRHKAAYRTTFGALTDLRRLGVTNLLDVVWDAIPFSFVLNAIWPIGTYLKTLDALSGVAEFRHYKTTKFVVDQSVELHGLTAQYKWESLERSGVSTNLPGAPVPGYRPSKSVGMVIAGLALLHQIKRNRDYSNTFAVLGR